MKDAKIRIIAVIAIVLMLSTLATTAIAYEEENSKVPYDLEVAVAGYNDAVLKGRHEDAWNYVERIDQIIAEMEGSGMKVEFRATGVHQGMSTVSVSVGHATEEREERRRSFSANEKQLEVANQLVGQDITMGEFMEQVFPEALENMPEKVVENMYATKMVWPGSRDPSSESNYPQTTTKAFKLASRSPTDVQPQIIPIVIHDASRMSATWPVIDFNSWSRVLLPHPWFRLPYMSVLSSLYFQDGTLKTARFDDGYNVYKVEAIGSYSTSTAGNYRVTGLHYAVAPPGYTPPALWGYSSTPWSYVGP